MVNTMEITIMSSGLSQLENISNANPPKNAPATAIVTFPKKYAVKNFAGLYFISPKGITMGSSGIGDAAAMKSNGKAQRLAFCASASKRCLLFWLRRPLMKNVIM